MKTILKSMFCLAIALLGGCVSPNGHCVCKSQSGDDAIGTNGVYQAMTGGDIAVPKSVKVDAWQGDYRIGMVQFASDNQVFLKVKLSDGSLDNNHPFYSQVSPATATGLLQMALQALQPGYKVKIFVIESRSAPNGEWRIFDKIQIGEGNFGM